MPPEEWRPIPGYEGLYEVSNQGRVRSLDRYVFQRGRHSWHPQEEYTQLRRGRILTPKNRDRGYKAVQLKVNGQRKNYTIHSLVALAFIGPRPPGKEILHLNGVPSDNRLENLRYGTHQENYHQTYEYGGLPGPTKLSPAEVREIRIMFLKGVKGKEVATAFHISTSTAYAIKNQRSHIRVREEAV